MPSVHSYWAATGFLPQEPRVWGRNGKDGCSSRLCAAPRARFPWAEMGRGGPQAEAQIFTVPATRRLPPSLEMGANFRGLDKVPRSDFVFVH